MESTMTTGRSGLTTPSAKLADELSNEIPTLGLNFGVIRKREAEVDRATLLSFAEWATGHGSDSIKTLLQRLHRILIPGEETYRTGLLELLSSPTKDLGMTICNVKESPHQILYNLYNTVSLADYKGYIMLQFSYMILKINEKGNFVAESKRETSKFEKRVQEKANAIRNALANAERSIYNCDPKQYVEGVNYVKLTKLLQGYIENEVNLNPYGTCRENCAFYVYTEYHGCYKEQFCSKQPSCKGKVVECRYVDSDMNICKSNDPDRRYDWIEYENGQVYGNKGKCLARNLFKVDSWWRYLFWHCSYCLCLCDNGNYNSDRYFNLREVTSDVSQNKVITGVRIVKHNRIIHFQIRQGLLLPRGLIDKSSLSWKPVDNYTITDLNVGKTESITTR
ncbi:UNVERIFIED_CONTAM: hypothetical protein PYX00_010108 [Menopon gallinae]|uniref:Uncharacterized protein n=1 Tax=Menopon gallinae TaxID=328185 RepID=A0AAW2HE16_9NEOP